MRTTVVKHRELMRELVEIQAHIGSIHEVLHDSQRSFSLGVRNQFCIYHLERSLIWLKRAIRLFKRPLLIVGCPEGQESYCEDIFNGYSGIRFFAEWRPGLLTKSTYKNEVIILYKVPTSSFGRAEALITRNPIVGFVGPSCTIEGIDYPIPLCFHGEKGALFFVKFWEAILKKRESSKSRPKHKN